MYIDIYYFSFKMTTHPIQYFARTIVVLATQVSEENQILTGTSDTNVGARENSRVLFVQEGSHRNMI